jgi:hypothetical protein
VSARRGWLPRAAIRTSPQWAAIGAVAPLLLAASTPKAPELRIHTINTNRLIALIPDCRRVSFVVPLHVTDAFDLAGRDLIGEHHRKVCFVFHGLGVFIETAGQRPHLMRVGHKTRRHLNG